MSPSSLRCSWEANKGVPRMCYMYRTPKRTEGRQSSLRPPDPSALSLPFFSPGNSTVSSIEQCFALTMISETVNPTWVGAPIHPENGWGNGSNEFLIFLPSPVPSLFSHRFQGSIDRWFPIIRSVLFRLVVFSQAWLLFVMVVVL